MATSTTFGASIVPTTPSRADEALLPPRLDSPALTPAVSRDDMSADYQDGKPIPPHSPFYQHPPASFERVHSRTPSKTNVGAFEKDLEAGDVTPLSAVNDDNPFTSKISVDCNKECKMWPSKNTLMQQRTQEKQRKRAKAVLTGCAPVRDWWSSMTKRNRLIVKILLALFLVGAIVGIAVGISVAVHGSYYKSDNNSRPVGDQDS